MNTKSAQTNRDFVASVVIPAHNEATVIARLLDSLEPRAPTGKLEVIVACNGCTDNTAEIARNRGATVVEVDAPSKIAALNAADEVALKFPRLYVDADVILTRKTVDDLVRALSDPETLCAAPPSNMDLSGRPWAVRAFFKVWKQVMLAKEGYVGAGVYAVSAKGRARFGRFPNVIADDLFVRNVFQRSERRVVATEPTIVEAPHTVRALLRRRVRVCIGNSELATSVDYKSLPGNLEPRPAWWKVPLKNPALIPASIVYASVNVVAKLLAYRQRISKRPVDWARDNTTRPQQAAE